MSYEFTLTLNREISEDESSALREGGCSNATITSATLPPDGLVVTQLDFDTEAVNLAEAIQAALDAVRAVPDLRVDTLDVPPQPSGLPDEDEPEIERSDLLELTAGAANGATPAAEEPADGAGEKSAEGVDVPEDPPASVKGVGED